MLHASEASGLRAQAAVEQVERRPARTRGSRLCLLTRAGLAHPPGGCLLVRRYPEKLAALGSSGASHQVKRQGPEIAALGAGLGTYRPVLARSSILRARLQADDTAAI